jgi:acyl CoA:acetate/3-ketoacid CoA transferase
MQVDKEGNVNPSMLPGRAPGPGGFPVIAAGVPRVYFAGLFTAGKPDIKVSEDGIKILSEGKIMKFVDKVYKIVFSGRFARMNNKEVLYVTERAIFKLRDEGLELIEIAPGIDIDRDIIGKMEFEPKVSSKLKTMDMRIYSKGKMGLRDELFKFFKEIGIEMIE